MASSIAAAAGVTVAALFPVMNPIGALPAFAALTAGESSGTRHAQALRGAAYAGGILIVFAVAGRPLLHAFGIGLPALQIAGGLIVGHSGYGMVVYGPRLSQAERDDGAEKEDVSFTPLAMPLLAGPGAIGVVIGVAARAKGLTPEIGIVLGCLAMALVIAIVLRVGEPVLARLGAAGIGALSRIFGFLILAIAVELVAHGVTQVLPGLLH
jgi:multiple antibiotic resistance protein